MIMEVRGAYLFNLQNVTGNDLGGLDLEQTTITEYHSLEGKGLLELVDNRSGLEFLDESNTGVEQQESADDTKVDPILEPSSKNSRSLGDVSR